MKALPDRDQNLAIAVSGIEIAVGALGFHLAWKLGEGNRILMQVNQATIQACDHSYVTDQDRNGWYTCPLWQLPMP